MDIFAFGAMVVVNWADSASRDGWNRIKSLHTYGVEAMQVKTVGYVIKHTDEYICVASSLAAVDTDDETACGIMTIPAKAVHSIIQIPSLS